MADSSSTFQFPECVFMNALEEEQIEELPKERTSKTKPKKKNAINKKEELFNRTRKTILKEFRERVQQATTKVDSSPPNFHPSRGTGVHLLRDDANVYMKRIKENIAQLVGISRIMRTHGATVPFRYEKPQVLSAVPNTISNLVRLERENYEFGKRLLEVRSEVDSGLQNLPDYGAGKGNKAALPFIMPEESLRKYAAFDLRLPATDVERRRLLRPRIYFDTYLKDARPIGRFVVQLYTEAAPLVVLELVRACLCNTYERFTITRLFPNLWFEIQLQMRNMNLQMPLEYDAKIIDHGSANHVLSFSKDYCKGFQDHVYMSLSFKPLSVVNGKRVGIGRVIRGSKICECMQSYGTKNGKLSRGILITSCGLL